MSWQEYIDTSLLGTGNIDQALICDVKGEATWASSPGFSLKDKEMKAIVSSFADRSETKEIVANGLKVNDVKYMTIEASEDSVKAKKGKEGIVVFKTTQALIIAHHPDSVQTPNAYNSVVELGEYLKKHGM